MIVDYSVKMIYVDFSVVFVVHPSRCSFRHCSPDPVPRTTG